MGEGEKQKLGAVRACARELFRQFLRPRFLRRRGCRTRWRPSAKSSPISRKSAQGLSRLLLLFRPERRCANERRGGSAIVPLCSSVGPAARSSRFPRACAPREVCGSWPNNGRLKWAFSLCGGRNGLGIHCGVRKNIVVFWGEMK